MTDFYERRVQFHLADKDHTFVDVPLASHIEGNLWMGAVRHAVRLPDDFKYVVSLHPWEQYDIGKSTLRVEFEMFDAKEMEDAEKLRAIADLVNHFTAHGQTLVHCQAGMNRSALISALALMRGSEPPELAEDAIEFLRECRHRKVLFNRTFEKWLIKEGER